MQTTSPVSTDICLAGCEGAAQHREVPPVREVIIDADADFDDTVAIAYLCREHHAGRIRIRAFTVVNTGAGYPGRAIRYLRCLRERCGLSDVPIAEGPIEAPNAFPAEIRDFADGILAEVFSDCTHGEQSSEIDAPTLIEQVLRDAEPGTIDILTFGPLTNIARALERDASEGVKPLVDLVGRVHSMGGAVRVSGNLCCGVPDSFDNTQEFNIFVDPGAAAQVLDSLPPGGMTFVPLDATNFVRIERDFIDRITHDPRTPEAELVAAIARRLTPGGTLYWWDVLSAVAAVHPHVVTYEALDVTVIEDGPSAGRTAIGPTGQMAYVATGACREEFERIFLATLNGESPRLGTFALRRGR
jgi:inosine-uridine nucleoside N-ribohydrolase